MKFDARMEAFISSVWFEVTGIPPQNDSDFFDLGGTSFLAVEVVSRISEELECIVPLEVMFLDGTFGGLVEAAKRACAS